MKKIDVSIEGMHCASCAAVISRGLEKTPGVVKSNVNYAAARAQVEFDETKRSLGFSTTSTVLK